MAELYPRVVIKAGIAALSELLRVRPEPPGKVREALRIAANEILPQDNPDRQTAMQVLEQLANHENTPGNRPQQ